MERILGLLETLESMICDSIKIPLTGKTLVNEADLLAVIDKIRLVLQSGEKILPKEGHAAQEFSHKSIEIPDVSKGSASSQDPEAKAVQIIQQAYEIAKEIRTGADKYADEILSGLEATTGRIIRTIKNGRSRLIKITDDIKQASTASAEVISFDEEKDLLLNSIRGASTFSQEKSQVK